MVLSFALRRRLQAGLASLVYAEGVEGGWVDGGGVTPPQPDANLLKSIRRLYQVREVSGSVGELVFDWGVWKSWDRNFVFGGLCFGDLKISHLHYYHVGFNFVCFERISILE